MVTVRAVEVDVLADLRFASGRAGHLQGAFR
jgi:hypothetical protein